MQKPIFKENISKDLIYALPGYIYFMYLLFPFRFWEKFVFSNQIETIVVTVFFSFTMLLFSMLKAYGTKIFKLTKADFISGIYCVFMLSRLRYPLEKEYLFLIFSAACIYLYFRNFPVKFLTGLLFLIPISCIVQIIDGIKKFTMPWQNISHITGIFNNTGLFGGFAALGLLVCIGMILFPCSENRYFKYINCSVSIVFAAALTVQIYASGSRASWIAAFAAILFLLYKKCHPALDAEYPANKCHCGLDPQSPSIRKIFFKNRWLSYLSVFCAIVLFAFSAKYLYDLKKDSADGRLIIGRISLEMVKKAPAFGNGISGFRAEYLNYQADYFKKNSDSPYSIYADDVDAPFNEFLKILVEQGIVGLLLFFCISYYILVIPSTMRNFQQTNVIAGLTRNPLKSIIIFILFFGIFSYPFDKLPFLALFVFSIAILSQKQSHVFELILWGFRIKRGMTFVSRGFRIICGMIFVALCFVAGKITLCAYDYSKSCRTWNKSLVQFSYDREESLLQLKKLYPEMENNPVFLTTYGKALGYGERYREATVILEKAVKRLPQSYSYIELGKSYEASEFPEKAFECWKYASFMVPSRFTPIYLSMKLHFKN